MISALLDVPAGFLPPDTAVCSYGSIVIKSAPGYKNYYWNTNSMTPNITITSPGEYWLQVTDNNNCVGKDTIIVVPKECMKGFFVPNAFTPNNDGKNDLFKPLLFGTVKKYSFIIYNRWGAVVFESSNHRTGWDGALKGIKQNSGVFVWLCRYQIEGEVEKIEKGTVTLIR